MNGTSLKLDLNEIPDEPEGIDGNVSDPDEISLRDVVATLKREKRTLIVALLIGTLFSGFAALDMSQSYSVESILSLSNEKEIAAIKRQQLIVVSPTNALQRVVDQILSRDVQIEVFKESALYEELSNKSKLPVEQFVESVLSGFKVDRVHREYYQLGKDEKIPFKEIRISSKSTHPGLFADFIGKLIKTAKSKALELLTNDILVLKTDRIEQLEKQIASLSAAASDSRQAEIQRIEESNKEAIQKLKQTINLKILSVKKDRLNSIIRIEESLEMATSLGIEDPVTWDDLRPAHNKSQITNEFGGSDATAPFFFRGARILRAELKQLKQRADDRPFIDGLGDLESKILELENDPRIAALKARSNDSIHLDKFDLLKQELASFLAIPESYSGVQLAIVSKQPTASAQPTRSRRLIFMVGLFITVFAGLFLALLASLFREVK